MSDIFLVFQEKIDVYHPPKVLWQSIASELNGSFNMRERKLPKILTSKDFECIQIYNKIWMMDNKDLEQRVKEAVAFYTSKFWVKRRKIRDIFFATYEKYDPTMPDWYNMIDTDGANREEDLGIQMNIKDKMDRFFGEISCEKMSMVSNLLEMEFGITNARLYYFYYFVEPFQKDIKNAFEISSVYRFIKNTKKK